MPFIFCCLWTPCPLQELLMYLGLCMCGVKMLLTMLLKRHLRMTLVNLYQEGIFLLSGQIVDISLSLSACRNIGLSHKALHQLLNYFDLKAIMNKRS